MSAARGEARRSVTSAGEVRSADEGGGDAEQPAPLADSALSFEIAGLHVLLVDDDPLCSMIVSKMLRRRARARPGTRARPAAAGAPSAPRPPRARWAPRAAAHASWHAWHHADAVPPPAHTAAATT
jgi:hypothetical protein